MEPARFEEMRPGCYDIDARVADMDIGRHLGLALLPLAGGRILRVRSSPGRATPSSGLACTRAWNRWHLEVWAGTHPDRIIPLQLPWLADVEVAAAEVRAQRRARASGRSASPSSPPSSACRRSSRGHWDPFFAACEETGHRGLPAHRGVVVGARSPPPTPPSSSSRPLFPVNALLAAGEWLWSGVPLRFPNLRHRPVRRGHGLGADAHGPGRLRGRPLGVGHRERRLAARSCSRARCSRRSFWFCTIDDRSVVPLRHRDRVDHIMVESDYPHADSTWPDTQAVLASTMGDLPEDELRAVAAGNAARLFRHPLPERDDWRGDGADASDDLGPWRRSTPTADVVEPPLGVGADGSPTTTGRASSATPTATSTWSWATPRSSPCRWAPWPPRGSNFADPANFRPLEEAQPGGSDPVARLVDMDAEGIDQAVLFPSVGLYFWALDDPAAAVAVARAYNDWLAGYCAVRRPTGCSGRPCCRCRTPRRRPPSCAGPSRELGFTAAFVRPNPCLGRSLCDPAYAPGVGGGRGARRGGRRPRGQLGDRADPRRRTARSTPGPPRHVARRSRRCWPTPSWWPSASSTATRRLKVVFLESGGGWAPLLAGAPRRAGRDLRRVLPRDVAASE